MIRIKILKKINELEELQKAKEREVIAWRDKKKN